MRWKIIYFRICYYNCLNVLMKTNFLQQEINDESSMEMEGEEDDDDIGINGNFYFTDIILSARGNEPQ